MHRLLSLLLLALSASLAVAADTPFAAHGRVRVAKSGTHLEHADGTPFFFLADTCWVGPALSTEKDWQAYLADRVKKGFTVVQFNMASPWRVAPTDADGNASYTITDGRLVPNEKFYARVDARLKAINDAGLLAAPILCWAHKKGDAGKDLTEEQIVTLVKFEVQRYKDAHVLWILAGDNQYTTDADMWKRIGRAVFGDKPGVPVTTHPTGENFPWAKWEDEKWLVVLGYQSGHGNANTEKWLTTGPVAEYGRRKEFTRPCINLEPCYENHNGYASKTPHTAAEVRRAVYWSLLIGPTAGVTYGGHGVWSWHTQAGKEPTDHPGTGIAKVWNEAIDLPAAGQMRHVRDLFESLPWTELRPVPELLGEQPGTKDPTKFVAAAEEKGGGVIVVYAPEGAAIKLALDMDKPYPVEWFNPRTGERTEGKRGNFTPPDENDWVLIVKTRVK